MFINCVCVIVIVFGMSMSMEVGEYEIGSNL